jgi:hypothetical protein
MSLIHFVLLTWLDSSIAKHNVRSPGMAHICNVIRASSDESGRKEPWWARRVEQGSERTKVHMGKLLPPDFPSKTSGTKSLPLAIQYMPHRILFHP